MIKLTKRKNPKIEENITMNPPALESNDDTNNKMLSNNNSLLSSSNFINMNDERKVSTEAVIQGIAGNSNLIPDTMVTDSKMEKVPESKANNEAQQQTMKRRIIPTFIK